jgi:hypothetical protein
MVHDFDVFDAHIAHEAEKRAAEAEHEQPSQGPAQDYRQTVSFRGWVRVWQRRHLLLLMKHDDCGTPSIPPTRRSWISAAIEPTAFWLR